MSYIVSNLPMPDPLHIMQLHMLDHPHKWIFHFTKIQGQPDKYEAICISDHPDHN
jgi:hypothetical protein